MTKIKAFNYDHCLFSYTTQGLFEKCVRGDLFADSRGSLISASFVSCARQKFLFFREKIIPRNARLSGRDSFRARGLFVRQKIRLYTVII